MVALPPAFGGIHAIEKIEGIDPTAEDGH